MPLWRDRRFLSRWLFSPLGSYVNFAGGAFRRPTQMPVAWPR